MSRENVTISLGGHTHGFLDLKPWMPRQYHAGFDIAMNAGKCVASAGTRMFSELYAARGYFDWKATNDLHNLERQRHHDVFTGTQLTPASRTNNLAVRSRCFPSSALHSK